MCVCLRTAGFPFVRLRTTGHTSQDHRRYVLGPPPVVLRRAAGGHWIVAPLVWPHAYAYSHRELRRILCLVNHRRRWRVLLRRDPGALLVARLLGPRGLGCLGAPPNPRRAHAQNEPQVFALLVFLACPPQGYAYSCSRAHLSTRQRGGADADCIAKYGSA